MIVAVASGKGGTGKTTVAVSLARSLHGNVRLLDCDVEEPNCLIFLKPHLADRKPVAVPVPLVDLTKCTACGRCAEICQYNAVAVVKTGPLVFPELCHGCGGCALLCPAGAVSEDSREIGVLESGHAGKMEFVHGRLRPGEAMSPPLIRAVRKHALPDRINIIDSPPGTSCPVITAIKDSDYLVLVTEPTPFGLHDLTLAVETARKMHLPFGVIINRADVGDLRVRDYCRRQGISVLLEIPHDRRIAEAYSRGQPMVEALPESRRDFLSLMDRVRDSVQLACTRDAST